MAATATDEFWEAVEVKLDELYFAGENDDETTCPTKNCKQSHETGNHRDLITVAEKAFLPGPDAAASLQYVSCLLRADQQVLFKGGFIGCPGNNNSHPERLLIRRLSKRLGDFRTTAAGVTSWTLQLWLSQLPCNHYLAEVEKVNRPGQRLDIVKKMTNNCLRGIIEVKRYASDVHDVQLDVELNVVYFTQKWNPNKTVPYGITEFKKAGISIQPWAADDVIKFLSAAEEAVTSSKIVIDEKGRGELEKFWQREEGELRRVISAHHDDITKNGWLD